VKKSPTPTLDYFPYKVYADVRTPDLG